MYPRRRERLRHRLRYGQRRRQRCGYRRKGKRWWCSDRNCDGKSKFGRDADGDEDDNYNNDDEQNKNNNDKEDNNTTTKTKSFTRQKRYINNNDDDNEDNLTGPDTTRHSPVVSNEFALHLTDFFAIHCENISKTRGKTQSRCVHNLVFYRRTQESERI